LAELAREDELRQVDLVRRLKLEKSTTSRLVSQLVARGWAERDPAPDDGRGVLIRLTAKGKAASDQISSARQARFKAVLDRIPEEQRDAVVRALTVLTEAVDET
jgi:DNA-binding MarR family transcriptional regulator